MRLVVGGFPGLPVDLVLGAPYFNDLVDDALLVPGEFPENPRDARVLVPLAHNLVGVVACERVLVLVLVDVELSADKAGVVAPAVILQVLECCLDGCHQYWRSSLFVVVSNSWGVVPVG